MQKNISSTTLLMGTQIEIKIVSDLSRVEINNVLEEGLNIFHKVVAQFTRFSRSSELGILNKSNGESVQVSAELFNLIRFGLEISNLSNGIFDITIIDLLEKYGYTKDYNFERLGTPQLKREIEKLLNTRPSFRDIELDPDNLTIKLHPGQKIDLGSIGKGYAIKLAKDYILGQNITNFLINAGGDVYAYGANQDGETWKASVFDPEDPDNNRISEVKNQAMALLW